MYNGLYKDKKLGNYLLFGMQWWGVMFLLTSCKVAQKTSYFNQLSSDTIITKISNESNELKIEKNDLLKITVSSLNHDLDEKFNAVTSSGGSNLATQQSNNGCWVDANGEVELHFLGKKKVEGLTKSQLVVQLQNDLLPFMKEPIVNVDFLNKKITVFGDLGAPRVLNIYDEHTSLLDAIVMCGDLKEDALIKDIMIFRDSANQKKIKHINLEDHSLFSSEFYYVKPNDIIYVKRDNRTLEKEEKRRNFQSNISLIVSFISLGVIIINTLKK